MNRPVFEPAQVPFDAKGLVPREVNGFALWPIDLPDDRPEHRPGARQVEAAVLSMGNPHAVLRVGNVAEAPVAELGPLIESHPRFPRKVNVGFMQVQSRTQIALRVFERDAGETLACGTGACAAVVAGIRLGVLDARVDVDTRGGRLTIEWAGADTPVLMTGPAETVFEGEIEL
jgi:diaminopimelate epimerase